MGKRKRENLPARQAAARAVIALMLLGAAGACSGAGDACPPAQTDIHLPADISPHANSMEWWYFTGHLWDSNRRRFGFEVSFFQTNVAGQTAYMAHFAVSDPQAKEHLYDQRLQVAARRAETLDLEVGGWRLWRERDGYRMQAAFSGAACDLAATARKPAAIHNGDGIIDMGGDGWSYYYSETRMEVSGSLKMGSEDFAVEGLGWHDHQWGDFDVFASEGWDWFSLQLEDGTELMLFVLRTRDSGRQMTGCTFVDRDGCARRLERFELKSHRTWESPHTGGVYPLDWTLSVPEIELEAEILATFDDQEMDSRTSTLNTYWEGEVTVSGTKRGKAVAGLGYVELAGYGPWGMP